jgi:hypothetical protein
MSDNPKPAGAPLIADAVLAMLILLDTVQAPQRPFVGHVLALIAMHLYGWDVDRFRKEMVEQQKRMTEGDLRITYWFEGKKFNFEFGVRS